MADKFLQEYGFEYIFYGPHGGLVRRHYTLRGARDPLPFLDVNIVVSFLRSACTQLPV